MQPDTSGQAPQPQATDAPQPQQTPSAPEAYQASEQRQTPVVTMTMGDIAVGGPRVDDMQAVDPDAVVEWQAQEYITTDKNPIWYAGLGIFVIGSIALDVLLLQTFFTVSALAVVIAIVLIVMHVRPARMINYKLDRDGLYVDEQLYPLVDYKSFGVLHDGKENTVHLIPVKRFKPSLQVYFPVESGEAIVDSLSSRLPMEELHLDFVDRIVHLFRL